MLKGIIIYLLTCPFSVLAVFLKYLKKAALIFCLNYDGSIHLKKVLPDKKIRLFVKIMLLN